MNTWRPEGWKNPYFRSGDFGDGQISWNEQPEFSTFEAGADAMLEALKKEATYLKNDGTAPYGYVLGKILKLAEKGWLVFIPDED